MIHSVIDQWPKKAVSIAYATCWRSVARAITGRGNAKDAPDGLCRQHGVGGRIRGQSATTVAGGWARCCVPRDCAWGATE